MEQCVRDGALELQRAAARLRVVERAASVASSSSAASAAAAAAAAAARGPNGAAERLDVGPERGPARVDPSVPPASARPAIPRRLSRLEDPTGAASAAGDRQGGIGSSLISKT